MSRDVGRRHSLDLALLWLWCRPAAITPITLLAWEPPDAMGGYGPKKTKRQKKKKTKNKLSSGVPAVAQLLKDLALSLQWLGVKTRI